MQQPVTPPRRRRSDRYAAGSTGAAGVPGTAGTSPSVPPSAELTRRRRAEPEAAALPEAPPPVMARPPKPAPEVEVPAPRMPRWLLYSLVACAFLILAMTAADALMQAYLTRCQEEREAAHQRVLDNHPVYYQDLIERYAAENNLRPAFVEAIILNESSYRRDAVSSIGARGLMQLTQPTAEWIAGKLDIAHYSFDNMFDAEMNIRFGTWYLNYLSKLFRGDPVLVACAYHAGQSTVAQWLSDPALSPDGRTLNLDALSDGPTKTYARRVTQAYGIYEALLYPAASDPALSDGAARAAAAGAGD